MDKLIQEAPRDEESGERLELIRGDQCEFGLVDLDSGLPHQKPTGFLTASAGVKESLSRRCSGLHTTALQGYAERLVDRPEGEDCDGSF